VRCRYDAIALRVGDDLVVAGRQVEPLEHAVELIDRAHEEAVDVDLRVARLDFEPGRRPVAIVAVVRVGIRVGVAVAVAVVRAPAIACVAIVGGVEAAGESEAEAKAEAGVNRAVVGVVPPNRSVVSAVIRPVVSAVWPTDRPP
jgi:hypothetical protein